MKRDYGADRVVMERTPEVPSAPAEPDIFRRLVPGRDGMRHRLSLIFKEEQVIMARHYRVPSVNRSDQQPLPISTSSHCGRLMNP